MELNILTSQEKCRNSHLQPTIAVGSLVKFIFYTSGIWDKYVAQLSPPAIEHQVVAGVSDKGLCTSGGGNELVLGDIRNLTLRFWGQRSLVKAAFPPLPSF